MNRPSACGRRGHEIYVGNPFGLAVALVVGKKNRMIFDDRPADGSTKLVALERRFARARALKVILGIQSAVPGKFINTAMKLIGAGARDGVDHTAGSFSIFRGIVVGESPSLFRRGNPQRP